MGLAGAAVGAQSQVAERDRLSAQERAFADTHEHSALQSKIVRVLAEIVDSSDDEDVTTALQDEGDIERGLLKVLQKDSATAVDDALNKVTEELDKGCCGERISLLQKNFRANKLQIYLLCAFVAWLFIATVFYRYGIELTWAQAFFFTVDSGVARSLHMQCTPATTHPNPRDRAPCSSCST